MSASRKITLFHSPNTRSTASRVLLEELKADYSLHVLNMKAGEQRAAAYLKINPMGKVPAVLHGEALITEQVAIFIYLADLYAEAGLAPALGDSLRGPYLRWMVFYGSCFEPAVIDRAQKRAPAPLAMSPYGDYDTMFATVTGQLEKGDYLLGSRFSALDILWGTALIWMTAFKLVEALPVIQAYTARINARASIALVNAGDAELAAAQAK
jgi:glutathione S-transferase